MTSTHCATPRQRGALALLSLSIAAGGALRTVFSPMQELAKHDLQLTDLQVSLVQGLALSIPVAVLSIPIGRLVDRSNRTRLLVGLVLCAIAGTFITATAPGFGMLFLGRMLAGLGAMCAIPVAISVAADLSTTERRGRSVLVLSLGQWVGIAAAFALGGWLGGVLANHPPAFLAAFGSTPWRSVHTIFAIATLILVSPLLLLREPARHELGDVIDPDFGRAMREIWARRDFLLPLFVGQVGVVMADAAAGIWAAPVLTRNHGLQPEQFAGPMGLAVLVSGIVGSVVGGIAADAGQKGMHRGGILAGAVIAGVISIPTSTFALMPGLAGFSVVLGLFLLCGVVAGVITATAIAVYLPNELRGVCLSSFVVVSSVIGFGIAPTVVTLVSDMLGGETHLAPALTATGLLVSVVSTLGFARAATRRPRSVPVD
jgi:MFS family permease